MSQLHIPRVEISRELLRRHRYKGTTQNWNDRRRDLDELHFDAENRDIVV